MDKAIKTNQFLVEEVRNLNESTYILRFSRGGMQFKPGQHIKLGLMGSGELKEYSIYSSPASPSIELLIKEVDDGALSQELRKVKPGDELSVKGPYGSFLADAKPKQGEKHLFIASGTGIAPFHSFILTYPEADYRLIHGIRNINEAYEREHYEAGRYCSCTSRGNKGDYNGRITDYLLANLEDKVDKIYLCGNSSMIYDAMDILKTQGYRQDQLFTEAYF